jgi:hypothetical protein
VRGDAGVLGDEIGGREFSRNARVLARTRQPKSIDVSQTDSTPPAQRMEAWPPPPQSVALPAASSPPSPPMGSSLLVSRASFSAAREPRRLGSDGVESIDAGQSARAGKSQSISQLFPSDAPESDEARHGAAGMMRVL